MRVTHLCVKFLEYLSKCVINVLDLGCVELPGRPVDKRKVLRVLFRNLPESDRVMGDGENWANLFGGLRT